VAVDGTAMIAYGCCVGSWDKFSRFIAPKVRDRPVMAVSGATSISAAYNDILNNFEGRSLDAVVLLHDDLEMVDPHTEEKIMAAIEDNVAIIGVAGGGPSMWWWNHEPIGHQMTDTRMVAFGDKRVGDVDIVEGSFMVLTSWAIDNGLRFDERYEFLGYDDVCLHAREQGMRVVVADITTHHHSTLGFKSPEVEAMWKRSEVLFESKWGKPCES
jgi:hypothetical protein